VIYDPNLTVGLPAKVSGPSGMNAIAHCVEALYAENANPITSLMAAEGLRALARALPIVVREPENIEARGDALYGAWLAANFRSEVGLEHANAQRGRQWFNLDHAHTHAVATPYAIGFNAAAAPEAMARIQRALGIAVLFSAHELNPLQGALDRVLYLGGGHAALGSVEEVFTGPVLSRLYGAEIEVVRVGGRVFVLSGGQDLERDAHRHEH